MVVLVLGGIFVFLGKKLKLDSHKGLMSLGLVFLLMAGVLGDACNFYNRFWWWDLIVHGLCGFIVVGLTWVILDSKMIDKWLLGVLALGVSMTVAVFWEFGEFLADKLFYIDAQRDTLVQKLSSFKLDSKREKVVVIDNIERVVLYDKDNKMIGEIRGGYLDLGISDTMGDLGVNLLGTVMFLGVRVLRNRGYLL